MISTAKKKILYFLKHPFTGLGIIVFIGSMSTNVLAYIFNLILSRALSTADFGIFSSLNSLTYLLYIPATTLFLVITKYVTQKKAKNELFALRYLFIHYTKYFLLFGIVVFLLLVGLSPVISSYLHVHDIRLLIFLETTFMIIFALSLVRGILNGLLRIVGLSINVVIESFGKIIFVVIFLVLGAGVLSGIISIALAMAVAYLFGLIALKDIIFTKQKKAVGKKENIPWKKLLLYGLPVFLTSFFLNSLYTNDIILVKHFFSPSDAGLYAAIALSGKIVFFGSGFLAGILFPYASFAHAKGESSKSLFFYTVFTTVLLAGMITLVFFVMPKVIIMLFFGSKYLSVAPLLGLFGIFISFLSVVNVFLNFFLSTMRLKAVAFPILATIAQAIGITLFHYNIFTVILVNTITTAVLLFCLMLYSVLVYGKGKRRFIV